MNIEKLVPDFKQVDMQAIIETTPLGELKYPGFFPSQYTTDLSISALEATFGASVMADVVAFDSRAPRKGRPTPGKLTGDIPKIEVARTKIETDIIRYRTMLNNARATRNPNALAAVVNWMYEDSEFVLQAVRARTEWLAKKAASDGRYKLTVVNNAGGSVTPLEIGFGIKDSHRRGVSALWSNPTTAKPITDIENLQKAARKEGYALKFATTDHDTMQTILAAAETQKYVATYVANVLDLQRIPTVEDLNSVLTRNGLPTFRVWDSYVAAEAKDGTITSETGWVEGHVNFSVVSLLGSIQWTETADGIISIDESTKATNDFVLVKVYAEQDPINVVTKGIAYATPVLDGASQMFILDSKTIEA